MANNIRAEYLWIDGQKPTAKLRSKTKTVAGPVVHLADIPRWSFDGSSTEQAEGHDSDRILKPVYRVPDPVRGEPNILVMCEVLNPDGSPHPSNTRTVLERVVQAHEAHEPWFGVEQEYTLYGPYDWPLGWPGADGVGKRGYPPPQGRFYCGVGCDEVYGRRLVEAHLAACLKAGISLYGVNAEVMPGQWEFQIGTLGPLETADQLWIARWLLYRLGEDFNIYAKLDPKPMPGDWNGAGAHTNFSTRAMREAGGLAVIEATCEKLRRRHREHIAVYGADNDKRLTGKHETCSINEFRHGVRDRGASVRIPDAAITSGRGYLEDRRPAANMDPYKVLTALIETACGDGFDPARHVWTDERYRYL